MTDDEALASYHLATQPAPQITRGPGRGDRDATPTEVTYGVQRVQTVSMRTPTIYSLDDED